MPQTAGHRVAANFTQKVSLYSSQLVGPEGWPLTQSNCMHRIRTVKGLLPLK